jgi:hypothetical protein
MNVRAVQGRIFRDLLGGFHSPEQRPIDVRLHAPFDLSLAYQVYTSLTAVSRTQLIMIISLASAHARGRPGRRCEFVMCDCVKQMRAD